MLKGEGPLTVPVISRDNPFHFDFDFAIGLTSTNAFSVNLKYVDLVGNKHETVLAVDVRKQLGPSFFGSDPYKDLERAIEKVAESAARIERAVDKAADAINRRR
ncbi:MAG TPA: hypothetical protein VM165_24990 [Planctomycetaceae bacterium]|nr:hypothetical protein [Planctomycetaceae bacterium]